MGVFKQGWEDLVAKLDTIAGLNVIDDPNKINPPCIIVEAPTINMPTNVIADMEFNVIIIGLGVGDKRTLTQLLDLADLIRAEQIGLTAARPGTRQYMGVDYPAYELTIRTKVSP